MIISVKQLNGDIAYFSGEHVVNLVSMASFTRIVVHGREPGLIDVPGTPSEVAARLNALMRSASKEPATAS